MNHGVAHPPWTERNAAVPDRFLHVCTASKARLAAHCLGVWGATPAAVGSTQCWQMPYVVAIDTI